MKEQFEIQKYLHHPVVVVEASHAFTTSLNVADFFGKSHKHVIRDIENLRSSEGMSEEFTEPNFGLSEYTDPTGRTLPMYRLTRDGFTLLVMGYTGPKALRFKIAYITQFSLMEAALREPKLRETLTAQEESHRLDLAAQDKLIETQDKLIETLEDASMYKTLYIDKITRPAPKPMTEREQIRVVELKRQGKSTSEIARATNRSSSTVSKVVRLARQGGELPPMPWSEKLRLVHLHPEWLQEVDG